jgi:hypothetical protein
MAAHVTHVGHMAPHAAHPASQPCVFCATLSGPAPLALLLQLVVGRSPECGLPIPDQEVSSCHATIAWSSTSAAWVLVRRGAQGEGDGAHECRQGAAGVNGSWAHCRPEWPGCRQPP